MEGLMWYAADKDGNITFIGSDAGPSHPRYSEVEYAREEAYERNGALVPYTPEQRAARQQRPPYPARWSNAEMRWIDLRTQEDIDAAEDAMRRLQMEQTERLTLRAIREMLLSLPNVPPAAQAARQQLQGAEDAIQRLRRPREPKPADRT